MRADWWWLRLQIQQWINAWRVQPIWRSLTLFGWFLPVVVLPAALALIGEPLTATALDWLLSFDVPLTLVLAAHAGSAMVALASRADTEDWISPAAARRTAGRALFIMRLLHALRWPVGLALAALLLSLGCSEPATRLIELLVIACFALIGGASLALLLLRRSVSAPDASALAQVQGRGLSVLSRVPLRETRRLLDPRRLALLAVPVLLGAPMESALQQVLRALAAWVALLYISNWCRLAGRTVSAMRQWMPRMRLPSMQLYWWVWRHVIVAALLCVAALWLGLRLTQPRGPAATP